MQQIIEIIGRSGLAARLAHIGETQTDDIGLFVSRDDKLIGEIHFGSLRGVGAALTAEGCAPEDKTAVLRAAVALKATLSQKRKKAATTLEQEFTRIAGSENSALASMLAGAPGYPAVADFSHDTAEGAVAEALSDEPLAGLSRETLGNRSGRMFLRFTAPKDKTFVFWKSMYDKPSHDDLHITPRDYPGRWQGTRKVALINGDTGACIGGASVTEVRCPKEAIALEQTFNHSGFGHVNHPFTAKGCALEIVLDSVRIRTREGIEHLREFLKGALAVEGRYVGVSGGFSPPLEYPENRLRSIGRLESHASAYGRHGAYITRGSEAACVWEYRTLEVEGALEGANVPSWFHREQWLDKYRDAEIRHGLF